MPHYSRRPPRLHFPAEALADGREAVVVPVAGSFTVGRSTNADMALRPQGVAKVHARFDVDDDGNVIVENIAGVVTTWVGIRDAKEGPVILRPGDVVSFNSRTTRCTFVQDDLGLLDGARRRGDWVVLQCFDGVYGLGLRLAIRRHPSNGSIEFARSNDLRTFLSGGDGVSLKGFESRLLTSSTPDPSVCQSIVEAVAGRDGTRDLEVGFDGVIRPGLTVRPAPPPLNDKVRRIADASTTAATAMAIARLVRGFFPEAARVNDELLEELGLLDDAALDGVPT